MIGIFDSGIGGFSVLKEVIKHYPNNKYIYYSDSINNPYGDKSNEMIISLVDNVVKYLIKKNCKIIIIACNTSSLIAYDYLTNKYKDIIFIKTIPALYKIKNDNSTLIMATNASIKSNEFNKMLNKYKNNYTYVLPCIGLAELIEQDNKENIDNYLKDKLKDYHNIKDVILGCTHYPIIKEDIKNVLHNDNFITCYDDIIKKLNDIVDNNGELDIEFIDSSNRDIESIFNKMLKEK